MKGFLKYAESASPATAKKLADAGGYSAALGGKDTFKQAWGDLAQDPGFGDLQHDYIAQKNYDPLVDKVK
jgi:hypothetical protein